MCRFIESILFENGKMPLLQGHEQRFVRTQMSAWGKIIYPSLEKIIRNKNIGLDNAIRYKCRVVYGPADTNVQFTPYTRKNINRLIIKADNDIDYHLKYENRERLNALSAGLNVDEEVLIIKDNLLTDTSFTNIALWNGEEWQTPGTPLLTGIQRNYLLSKQIISERKIYSDELPSFQKIRLFNALVHWEDAWELPVSAIRQINL